MPPKAATIPPVETYTAHQPRPLLLGLSCCDSESDAPGLFDMAEPSGEYKLDMSLPYSRMLASELLYLSEAKKGHEVGFSRRRQWWRCVFDSSNAPLEIWARCKRTRSTTVGAICRYGATLFFEWRIFHTPSPWQFHCPTELSPLCTHSDYCVQCGYTVVATTFCSMVPGSARRARYRWTQQEHEDGTWSTGHLQLLKICMVLLSLPPRLFPTLFDAQAPPIYLEKYLCTLRCHLCCRSAGFGSPRTWPPWTGRIDGRRSRLTERRPPLLDGWVERFSLPGPSQRWVAEEQQQRRHTLLVWGRNVLRSGFAVPRHAPAVHTASVNEAMPSL